MTETDTATIRLTKGEAREVINALSNHEVTASGTEEERAVNMEAFLQREFGFEPDPAEGDRSFADAVTNVFGADNSEHDVELSRAEAAEVERALDDLDERADPADENEAIIEDLRRRFAETFDLDGGRTA